MYCVIFYSGTTFHCRRQLYSHVLVLVYRTSLEVIPASVTGGLSINRMEPTVVVGPKTPTTRQLWTNEDLHVFSLEVWLLLCIAETIQFYVDCITIGWSCCQPPVSAFCRDTSIYICSVVCVCYVAASSRRPN